MIDKILDTKNRVVTQYGKEPNSVTVSRYVYNELVRLAHELVRHGKSKTFGPIYLNGMRIVVNDSLEKNGLCFLFNNSGDGVRCLIELDLQSRPKRLLRPID